MGRTPLFALAPLPFNIVSSWPRWHVKIHWQCGCNQIKYLPFNRSTKGVYPRGG